MQRAEQIKFSCAVIGAGAFGKHYIRLLSNNKRATLSAVASPSAIMHDATGSADVKRYVDPKNIFADPAIDAVVIATPLSTHAPLAIAALLAGKHVLLEKPLAQNLEEAKKIERAVLSAGKVFMLGHQYLYNDDIFVLKKELGEGRIGNVRYIHAEQLYPGPIRHDVGCFREAATHEIGLIDHFFSPGTPLSVSASTIDLAHPSGATSGGREDFAAVTIRYASGLFAHIVISQYSPVKSRRMIFGGDAGMAVFDDRAPVDKVTFLLRPFPKEKKLRQTKSLPIPSGETFTPATHRKEPLAQEIEHFLDCIETNTAPRSDIAHAMRVERVLDAVSAAMKPS